MSAQVMHGRRKGQAKEINLQFDPNQMKQPLSAGNIRNVTVLGKNDWQRIQYQLNKRVIEKERREKEQEELEKRKKENMERYKSWPNTLKGGRAQKLEARRIREEKEEEERKLMDIEEAKFQQQKRKEAIEKAKTQQYYQTDRVKGFHSALLHSEVLKERDAQVELKRLKEKAMEGQDNYWLDMARKEYEEGILKDQDEARKRIQATRETAAFQKAQVNQHLKLANKEREEADVEGEELKRLAAQYELEKKRLAEIRQQEANQLLEDNIRQINDVERMKKINRLQEEEEDDECRIFAAAKRKMMKLRFEKEKHLHKEKQERLEKIREKLAAQQQQAKDDEDERIRRAVEEAEAKRAKEETEKEEKTAKAFAGMAAHRKQQLAEQERKEAEARKAELEALIVKREADEIFARNEEQKRLRKLEEAKNVQDFRSAQHNEKELNNRRGRELALAQDQKNQELVELEERQFQEYAKKVINHAERGGRNTFPLHKAAQEGAGGGLGPVFPGKGGVRPSYMTADQTGVQLPNYQRTTTEETKQTIYGNGDTQKRLGFVW